MPVAVKMRWTGGFESFLGSDGADRSVTRPRRLSATDTVDNDAADVADDGGAEGGAAEGDDAEDGKAEDCEAEDCKAEADAAEGGAAKGGDDDCDAGSGAEGGDGPAQIDSVRSGSAPSGSARSEPAPSVCEARRPFHLQSVLHNLYSSSNVRFGKRLHESSGQS